MFRCQPEGCVCLEMLAKGQNVCCGVVYDNHGGDVDDGV